jgi:MFS family permease
MNDASKKRWALALTSLAAFIVVLDSQVMTVALATIRSELRASFEALQWTLNAYTLTFSVLLLAGAALGERFGRRRIFVAGIALFVAASAACALAPNIGADVSYARLIAPLMLAGVGVSLAMPATQRMILNAVARPDVGKASGTFTMLRYLGGIFGVALLVTVFDRTGGLTSPQAFSAGFGPAMWTAAAFSFLAAAAGSLATKPAARLAPAVRLGQL